MRYSGHRSYCPQANTTVASVSSLLDCELLWAWESLVISAFPVLQRCLLLLSDVMGSTESCKDFCNKSKTKLFTYLSSSETLTKKYLKKFYWSIGVWGLPWWLSGKEHTCQFRKWGFKPWVRKLPGKETATHSSVLVGKSHGQRSLVGHSS